MITVVLGGLGTDVRMTYMVFVSKTEPESLVGFSVAELVNLGNLGKSYIRYSFESISKEVT